MKQEFDKYQKLNQKLHETQLTLNLEDYEETLAELNGQIAALEQEKVNLYSKV